MPAPGSIVVSQEDLVTLAGQLASEGDQPAQMLTTMNGQIESVAGSGAGWAGSGATAFLGATSEWQSSATTLMQSLETIAKLVSSAAGAYTEADSQIGASFNV